MILSTGLRRSGNKRFDRAIEKRDSSTARLGNLRFYLTSTDPVSLTLPFCSLSFELRRFHEGDRSVLIFSSFFSFFFFVSIAKNISIYDEYKETVVRKIL